MFGSVIPFFDISDTFVITNVSDISKPEGVISKQFSLIGQPVRIQILLVIARQEACVCHLKAVTGMRQASKSQKHE